MLGKVLLLALLSFLSTASVSGADTTWSWQEVKDNETLCIDRTHVGEGPGYKDVYLGRALYNGNKVPATVQPWNISHPVVFSFEGQLLTVNSYEVMCGEGAAWQVVQGANSTKPLPAAALAVGYLEDGTELYACKRSYIGTGMGVVDPVTHRCNFTSAESPSSTGYDQATTTRNYDVLVQPCATPQ